MIEDPQRLEAEGLGLPRELDRPGPGVGGLPAVVLALPALRRHQPDLHAFLLVAPLVAHGDEVHGTVRGPGRRRRPAAVSRRARRVRRTGRSLACPAYPRDPTQGTSDDRRTDIRPDRPPRRAARTMGVACPRRARASRAAVSHDRDDRGRTGAGPPDHRAASGGRGEARRTWRSIRTTLAAGDPVVVTGCGTSEHGALAAVEILREAARAAGLRATVSVRAGVRAVARAAHPRPRDRHHARGRHGRHERGTPGRTRCRPIDRGRTVSGRSPAAALADIVVETEELDQGWCHTVGYLSPIVAAAAVGAPIGTSPGRRRLRRQSRRRRTRRVRARERIAAILADAAHLLVIASGADRPAGRELVLKVEEASWLPSAYRDLETFLHGHLPATGRETGLVLILADRDRRSNADTSEPGACGGPGHRAARRRDRLGGRGPRARSGAHAGRAPGPPRGTSIASPARRLARGRRRRSSS